MVAQALEFLMEIKKNSYAFDYWFTPSHEQETASLYFSGFFIEKKVWMIGVTNSSTMLSFLNQLQEINNQQVNQIRLLSKHKMEQQLSSTRYKNMNSHPDENFMLDELSQLNNELVNLQREITKKNVELQRVNELKNKFLGMAAHDLRNPLGNIMLLAEFLMEETKEILNDEQYEFLSLIASSSEFMLKLIEDLLDITRIESGKLNLNFEQCDLIRLAQQSIQLNNTMAAKKEIAISLKNSHNQINIKIDRQKIEQVFNNLLSNAVKFSHPQGKVTVGIFQSENKVMVEVTDQGTGIPQKHLETIFQPFNKVSSKGTAGEKSTGLGLSIVKRIIEGHKGKIAVESLEGKGSRFYFELPLID